MARPVWALLVPWDTALQGGVTEVVLNLAHALAETGTYEPVVIVQDWAAPRPREAMREGIRHIHVRLRVREVGWRGVRQALTLRIERARLRRLFARLNVAVLNPHFPTLAAENLRDLLPDGARVIFSLHGLDILAPPVSVRARLRAMLARGDAVVAVSDAFAAEVRAVAPELDRLVTIHNGVAPTRLMQAEAPPVTLPARFILNVSGYETKKGQKFLLDAFNEIADDYADVDLVFVGNRATELDPLVARARDLRLTDRVRFLVDVPHRQIGAIYRAASLFCLSSLAEPFGLVLLEAGLFGLPVVATEVGGVAEIVADGVDGILVAPASASALATGLRALLDEPAMAADLGQNLCRRVLNDFTWSSAAASYCNLLK